MDIQRWNVDKNIHAGTTLRNISKPEANNMALHVCNKEEDVLKNRQALSEQLNISANQWVFANQTHSDHIHKVCFSDMGKGAFSTEDAIADCDALYTKEANIGIGVFTADCVAILLYDPASGIIAAIHSGWLGTTKEITRKTLELLQKEEGVDCKNLHAYISLAINYDSLEVGDDVITKVKAMSFDTSKYIRSKGNGKFLLDNKGLNVQMLKNAGVLEENICINPNDTFYNNPSFFSYRRDHSCGRHLSYIVKTK